MMIHIYWSCLSFRYADKLNYTLFIFLKSPVLFIVDLET
jgi:hypothetical protein